MKRTKEFNDTLETGRDYKDVYTGNIRKVIRLNKVYYYEEYIPLEKTLNHWTYDFQWYKISKEPRWKRVKELKGVVWNDSDN